jgi:magnesium chelatase family protein
VNADVPGAKLRAAPWALPHRVLAPAQASLVQGRLSARGFDRVLRLAWTVADLAGHTVPEPVDVVEALYFRTGQVETWAA